MDVVREGHPQKEEGELDEILGKEVMSKQTLIKE
jgi:hypothetical protein